MNYKTIIFLLVVLNINCFKEFDIKTGEYYFLRGVIVNNYAPIFKLFKCNLEGESEVPFNQYKLEINTNDGQNEKMFNGKFSFIKGKSGVEYTVLCHVNNKFYSFKKTQPILDTLNINESKVIKGNELYIYMNEQKIESTFFLSSLNSKNINDFLNLGMNSIFFNNGTIKPLLKKEGNRLQLWPPEESENYREVTHLYYTKRCFKPFTWSENLIYSYYSLFQMHKSDYEIITQIQKNKANKEEPLYVGEACKFDYKDKEFIGHVFTYTHYEKIKLNDFLDYENPITFQILKNSVPIDTIKNTNIRLTIKFQEFNYGFASFQRYQNNGILLFKDYIAYHHNYFAYQDAINNGKLGNISCGNYQPSYKYIIYISYRDNTLGKEINYTFPKTYEYKYQSENIILNVP